MSNQEADWIMPTSMSGSDLSFEDTADLCESSNLSLFNVSSFDGESSDSNEDHHARVPVMEDQSAQADSLRELLKDQCAQHADEVAKLKRDLLEAHTSIHAQFREQTRLREEEVQRIQSEHDAHFGELRQKYKAAGKQLAAAQAQTQGIFQDLTDDRLTQKARILWQSVKALASLFQPRYMHGANGAPGLRWLSYETGQAVPTPDGHPILRDNVPVTPASMQVYLWHIIVKRVSGKFLWAGDDADACQYFWHRLDTRNNCDAQAIRRLKIWRATTASLLLGPAASQGEMTGNADAADKIHGEVSRVCELAFPYPYRMFAGFKQEYQDRYRGRVYDIVAQAVRLDLEICKQGAEVYWDFGDGSGWTALQNPDLSRSYRVILAPGLVKRGKSNGEELELEPRVLLQREETSVA